LAITNLESIDKYIYTYKNDEDRETECQYCGRICEQCTYFRSVNELIVEENISLKDLCFLDECINPAVPCEDCFLLNTDNDYFDEEDIEIDDEDIITFVNFDIEGLPF